MYRLLLVAVCCVFSVGSAFECGPLQRLKVKSQWSQSFGFEGDREEFNLEIWQDILKKYPETKERYFTRVRGDNEFSPEFQAHMARVMSGFDMTLSMIDEEEVFQQQIAHLQKQHVDLDVDAKYFDGFRESVMDVVQARIGRCFDKDAWLACMTIIEDGMKH